MLLKTSLFEQGFHSDDGCFPDLLQNRDRAYDPPHRPQDDLLYQDESRGYHSSRSDDLVLPQQFEHLLMKQFACRRACRP